MTGTPIDEDGIVAPALSNVSPISASDAVRARICLAIELGLLQPGGRLPSDARSAEALGVSTMTVRRVFGALADEGLLERRRGRGGGTLVAAHVDLEKWASDPAVVRFRGEAPTVISLIEQRTLIEAGLSAEAAWRATDGASAPALAEAGDALAAADAAADWTDFHEADERFHRAIVRASGQHWAVQQHERVAQELYGYFVPYPMAYLRESNREHHALLTAVRRGDAQRAADIAREHVLELKRSMYIAEHPSGRNS